MNKNIFGKVAVLGAIGLLATSCGGGSKMQFWTGFGASVESYLKPILEDFTEETGIKIAYETKGGYDNLFQAIQGGVTTKSFPQLAVAYPDHMASYIASGILLPLDSFVKSQDPNLGYDLNDVYSDYLKENQSFGVYPDGHPYEGEEILYGLPFNKSTEVMAVNNNFFEWLGSVDSTIVIPKTWDEVSSIGNKALTYMKTGNTKNNGSTTLGPTEGAKNHFFGTIIARAKVDETEASGYKYEAFASNNEINEANKTATQKWAAYLDFTSVASKDFRIISYDSQPNFFITVLRQWGSTYTYVKSIGGKTVGYIGFNTGTARENALAALSFFKQLSDDGIIGIPATWGESSYCSNPFQQYKTMMNIGSSGGIYNATKEGIETVVEPIPYKDATAKYVISQGTNLVMFNKGTEDQQKEAFRLIKYLTTGEANATFARQSGYYPATKSSATSEIYTQYINSDGATLKEKSTIGAARVNNNVYLEEGANPWEKFVDPGFNGSTFVRDSVTNVMQNMFVNGKSAEEALNTVLSVLADYIEE